MNVAKKNFRTNILEQKCWAFPAFNLSNGAPKQARSWTPDLGLRKVEGTNERVLFSPNPFLPPTVKTVASERDISISKAHTVMDTSLKH